MIASVLLAASVKLLDTNFSDPGTAYILMDSRSAEVLAHRWAGSAQPAPVGSLVKPFTALAYAQGHGFSYPTLICDRKSRCWLPTGHGRMGIKGAVGQSCNAYFRALAKEVTAVDVGRTAGRFGIPGPPPDASEPALIGIGAEWLIPPTQLMLAYREIDLRRAEPGVAAVLSGMRLSAISGTGRLVGREVAIKTGTAPCVHGGQPGDGFALVLHPAFVLLVRLEGRPGSHAAEIAGRMLNVLGVR